MITEYLEEWTYIAVFVLAAIPWIELVVVIPLGIVMGLNPIAVGVLGLSGNWITMFLVIVMFDRWREWRSKRKKREGLSEQNEESTDTEEETRSSRKKRAHRIWRQYGLPGLAFSGPLLIGSHIAAAVAMAFHTPRAAVTVWMTLSLILWTTVLVIATYYGVNMFGRGE